MSTNLQEIRTAVQNYLDTKVTVSIGPLVPVRGTVINPNEEFTFKITAINANAANGGVALKNVRWRIWVENPEVGKLIVPSAPMIARSGPNATYPQLDAGKEVAGMYLFPPGLPAPFPPGLPAPSIPRLPIIWDPASYLHVGDTDTILGLKGKAGSAAGGGTTNIRLKILAEVDMDYLFPKNEDSPTYSTPLNVIG